MTLLLRLLPPLTILHIPFIPSVVRRLLSLSKWRLTRIILVKPLIGVNLLEHTNLFLMNLRLAHLGLHKLDFDLYALLFILL